MPSHFRFFIGALWCTSRVLCRFFLLTLFLLLQIECSFTFVSVLQVYSRVYLVHSFYSTTGAREQSVISSAFGPLRLLASTAAGATITILTCCSRNGPEQRFWSNMIARELVNPLLPISWACFPKHCVYFYGTHTRSEVDPLAYDAIKRHIAPKS